MHHVIFLVDSISIIIARGSFRGLNLRICHLLKQVKEAGCIGEDHDVAEEGCSDKPNFFKLKQFFILIFYLLYSYHCLSHIETYCVDGVNKKN
jgi:hypothetical protein